MKTVLFSGLLTCFFILVSPHIRAQQTSVNPSWHAYQVQVSGIDSFARADYLSRGLEKIDLVLFAAFSFPDGNGYVVSSMPNIDNIITYVNNWGRGFNINTSAEVVLTDSLFLNIYLLRSNIDVSSQFNQKLPFIGLGPKKDLANLFFSIARAAFTDRFYQENPQYNQSENQ